MHKLVHMCIRLNEYAFISDASELFKPKAKTVNPQPLNLTLDLEPLVLNPNPLKPKDLNPIPAVVPDPKHCRSRNRRQITSSAPQLLRSHRCGYTSPSPNLSQDQVSQVATAAQDF